MKRGFANLENIKKKVRSQTETGVGQLRLWHQNKYSKIRSLSFEDRTLGDILEEFYLDALVQAEQLRSRTSDLESDERERLDELEDLLETGSEKHHIEDLSPEDREKVWKTAHRTGDPLIDKWEQELALGKTPNLDEF